MVAIIIAGAAITIAFGERIGINRGEGWDGQGYAAWARDFHREVLERGLNKFYSQRVLPSAVIHYGMRGLGVATTGPNVIVGFQGLNAALLAGCAMIYGRIALRAAWSRSAAWVGFVALFASFAVARNALYYATMTDTAAFALGLAATWAFLETRPIALLVITLLAGGAWPPLMPVCAAMAVFPRPTPPLPEFTARRSTALAIGLLAAGTALWALLVLPSWPTHGREKWVAMIDDDLRPVTMTCVIVFVGLAFHALARAQLSRGALDYLRFLNARRVRTALVLAGLVVIYLVRGWWMGRVTKAGGAFELANLPPLFVLETLRGPLWNVVHNVVYFGPIVLLVIWRWYRITAIAAEWGPAPMLALAMTVALSIGTESRQLSHAIPMLVILAIFATADRWTARHAIGFSVLGLAWSKIWLVIGYDRVIDSLKFPNQWFMMHVGPWASDTAYRAHLAATLVSAIVLWLLLRPRQH
jgi:hypothetical protein